VGRIPVYSSDLTQLDAVLSKTMAFGDAVDTDWRKSALLPMSYSDGSTDGAYLSDYMIDDYLDPQGYDGYTLYMQGGICSAANSTFSSDEELLGGAVKQRWMNHPYGLVWWWGHGSSTLAQIGYSGCGTGTLLTSGDATALNDDYPSFVYQCSCLNGKPEDSNNLGTALLYNGAVATVSASRVSWYAVTSWYPNLKYYCDNASIGYYYGRELVANNKPGGAALFDVKSDMGVNHYTHWGGVHWQNLFDFNLYGDPATAVLEKASDSDGDGLIDRLEWSGCTSRFDADSDDDGLSDGDEDMNQNGSIDAGETDPCNIDTDGDGVQDGTEYGITTGVADPDGSGSLLGTDTGLFIPDANPETTTDLTDVDSDGDGYSDGEEDLNFNGSVDSGETDPNDDQSYPQPPVQVPGATPLSLAVMIALLIGLGIKKARRLK
jgi:hypothetical protein